MQLGADFGLTPPIYFDNINVAPLMSGAAFFFLTSGQRKAEKFFKKILKKLLTR